MTWSLNWVATSSRWSWAWWPPLCCTMCRSCARPWRWGSPSQLWFSVLFCGLWWAFSGHGAFCDSGEWDPDRFSLTEDNLRTRPSIIAIAIEKLFPQNLWNHLLIPVTSEGESDGSCALDQLQKFSYWISCFWDRKVWDRHISRDSELA